jgi:gamma-glutamyl-gamma-aminobutyrate hydrolase PuuD
MKIAVSQREIILKNSIGDDLVFDGIERAWAKFLQGHDLVPVPNTVDIEHLDFDCLLLTGGPDSVARHLTENALYAVAYKRDLPIVGVCHGAFAINDIAGGVNGRVEGHIGTLHTVMLEGQLHEVNSYHSQSIESLGEDFLATGWDPDGTIEAFQHKTRPIYGIVWHPERQSTPVLPQAVRNLFQCD